MKTKYFPIIFIVFTLVIAVVWSTSAAADTIGTLPRARGYHQMAYDSESGFIVMYGGQTGYWLDPLELSHETWLFDPTLNTWTEMVPVVSPGGSAGGDMAYNSSADRSILVVMSDDWTTLQTWAYDVNSNTWKQKKDGPVAMVGQRIVYDSESDRIIMFGGFDMTKFKFIDETWAYDYNTDTWINMKTIATSLWSQLPWNGLFPKS